MHNSTKNDSFLRKINKGNCKILAKIQISTHCEITQVLPIKANTHFRNDPFTTGYKQVAVISSSQTRKWYLAKRHSEGKILFYHE
jgi:hypothetical protein